MKLKRDKNQDFQKIKSNKGGKNMLFIFGLIIGFVAGVYKDVVIAGIKTIIAKIKGSGTTT